MSPSTDYNMLATAGKFEMSSDPHPYVYTFGQQAAAHNTCRWRLRPYRVSRGWLPSKHADERQTGVRKTNNVVFKNLFWPVMDLTIMTRRLFIDSLSLAFHPKWLVWRTQKGRSGRTQACFFLSWCRWFGIEEMVSQPIICTNDFLTRPTIQNIILKEIGLKHSCYAVPPFDWDIFCERRAAVKSNRDVSMTSSAPKNSSGLQRKRRCLTFAGFDVIKMKRKTPSLAPSLKCHLQQVSPKY